MTSSLRAKTSGRPIEEKEMKTVKALLFYGRKGTPNEKGEIKLNLTQMQNDSMRDLGTLFNVDDVNSLGEKKLVGEKFSLDGALAMSFNLVDLETQFPLLGTDSRLSARSRGLSI
jgi:hypothetical protein